MKKDTRVYLEDVIDSIHKIAGYIKDMSYETFENEIHWQDAVLRRLEIIGEAVSKLPDDYLKAHAQIEWRKMKGVRNIIIHDYASVDIKQIWEIVTKDLPHTKAQIEELLKN
ncbi:DUF86 domain-containing protein [Candidatus Roizmanbacteria bacterium CG_4_10_14_0_8_um_filter_39_9]|uniref:DUF86 domain-containing protein n=1 Tax=Candidatus Roizmanbacteria bacterium CG_4_10_14_0_8_um_filter_39_9 TaxID=1974829 RepID=A0A2M7QE23_9BACT|nr:MAG: DUF86 domain-containing protein [Candidatus Roizmanbacteria bacterium CG_4_10_14_0_8_um_filter_39_9]